MVRYCFTTGVNMKLILPFILVAFSFLSQAEEEKGDGGLLEFYYGYSSGSMEQTYENYTTDTSLNGLHEYDYDGGQFGVRVGRKKWGFVFGLEGQSSSLDYEYAAPNGSTRSGSMTQFFGGGFVMYRGFDKVKLWASALIEGTLTYDNYDRELSDGFMLKFGVGYQIFKYLQLNAEFQSYSYGVETNTTTEEETTLPTENGEISKFDGSQFLVSLSIPISL